MQVMLYFLQNAIIWTKHTPERQPQVKRISFSAHRTKYIIALICLLSVLLLGLLVVNAVRLHKTIEEANITHRHLLDCDQAGDLLRNGSDILTNAVRSYVVTGDTAWRDAYFKEANEDRHREAGLAKVATLLNGVELQKVLAEGMSHSVELMHVEYHAMRLVANEQDLASPDCPPEIRNFALSEAELAASPEKRREMALALVFDRNYATYKDNIYDSTDKTLESAREFFSAYRTSILKKNRHLYTYQVVTFIGFVLILFIFVTFMLRLRGRTNVFIRKILDNIPALFFVKDARSERYIGCNMAFARYACRNSVADVIGKTDADLFDAETAHQFVQADRDALSSNRANSFLEHALDGKGQPCSFLTTKFKVSDLDGNTCIFGMSQDVTDAMEKQHNSEALAESLFALQSYDDASYKHKVIEIVRKRLGANFCHLIHCDEAADQAIVEPHYHSRLNPEAPCERIVASLDDFRACTKRIVSLEPFEIDEAAPTGVFRMFALLNTKTGVWLPVTTFSMPVTRAGQHFGTLVIGYAKKRVLSEVEKEFIRTSVAVLENALERKLSHDNLRTALDREIAAEQAKSYFFSSVSHDIRTPLNAIIGYSELLIGGIAEEEERNKALSAISTSGHTLLQLINDVLDLSKLESGKMVIKPVLTDVRELVSSVLHSFDVTVKDSDVDLKEEYGRLPMLELDPQRIRQILFNLIGNSVKFTEQGEICVRASFRNDIDDDSGVFTLSVSDTGCGIAEEDKKKLMAPFVQAGANAKIKGTGLGLAICKQLAARMGGQLSFVSELGKGSTFTLELRNVKCTEYISDIDRVIAAGQELVGGRTRRDAAGVEKKVREVRKDLRNCRILIADDVPLNLAVLKALLKKIGMLDVVTAVDGEDAWEKIQASDKAFDWILTDIWMPKMDGKELAAKIRADKRFAGLPVYAVTADIEEKKAFAEHGFTDVLLKPLTIDKLSRIFI